MFRVEVIEPLILYNILYTGTQGSQKIEQSVDNLFKAHV